jgi:hypothetical protein
LQAANDSCRSLHHHTKNLKRSTSQSRLHGCSREAPTAARAPCLWHHDELHVPVHVDAWLGPNGVVILSQCVFQPNLQNYQHAKL